MSTSIKRDGKPKLASGQILDDVMKSVDAWNGEPHGWLRGRIELVERALPVVKVFVRLALENTTVFDVQIYGLVVGLEYYEVKHEAS